MSWKPIRRRDWLEVIGEGGLLALIGAVVILGMVIVMRGGQP